MESEKYVESFTFHFDTENKDLGVVMENGRIAQIEAMCEDRFKRHFLAIRYFFTYYELHNHFLQKGTFFHTQHTKLLDAANELVLDSKIDWVQMTQVKDRCFVYKCTKDRFDDIINDMELSIRELLTIHMKFCQWKWTGTELVEVWA